MICKRCKSTLVMEPSGLCVECGFRNLPAVDLEKEARLERERRAREEAERKQREQAEKDARKQALMEEINAGFSLVTSGKADEVGAILGGLEKKLGEFENKELQLAFMKLKADYFRSQKLTTKYIEILKQLVPRLAFCPENYEYLYALGAAYQDKGNNLAARKIFDIFMDNYITHYKDVKDRFEKSCSGATVAGADMDGRIQVRTGAFDLEAESIRKWIDAAGSANRYFSSGILLNNNKDHMETIDDLPVSGTLSRQKVIEQMTRLHGGLMDRFAATRESIQLLRGDAAAGEEIKCILFSRKDADSKLQRGEAGMVRIAARLVGFDRITIVFYIIFQPYAPEALEDMSPRDFNEKVRRVVQTLHPIENDHEIITLVEAFKRAVVDAVRSELAATDKGPMFF